MRFTLQVDPHINNFSKKPLDKQLVARIVVICLLLGLGFLINFVLMMAAGTVAWYGGVIFWYGQFSLTFGLIAILFFRFRSSWKRLIFGILGLIVLWPVLMIGLYVVSEKVTITLSQRDAERILRSYGNGELPPGCTVGLPYRAQPGTAVDCTSTIEEVKKFFISKQGGTFTETSDENGTNFVWSKLKNRDFSIEEVRGRVYIHVYHEFPLTW